MLRALGLIHDADAATVLPDMALVALDEKAASVFSLRRVGDGGEVLSRRRAGVVLKTADAASNFIVGVNGLALVVGSLCACVLSPGGSTSLSRIVRRGWSSRLSIEIVVGEGAR